MYVLCRFLQLCKQSHIGKVRKFIFSRQDIGLPTSHCLHQKWFASSCCVRW